MRSLLILIALSIPLPALAATCSLSAVPSKIAPGQQATLRWSTADTFTAYINNRIGQVAPNTYGSKSIGHLSTTTLYTLTALGETGGATCTTTVSVISSTSTPYGTLTAQSGSSTIPLLSGVSSNLGAATKLSLTIFKSVPNAVQFSGWVENGQNWLYSVAPWYSLPKGSYIGAVSLCPKEGSFTDCTSLLSTRPITVQP